MKAKIQICKKCGFSKKSRAQRRLKCPNCGHWAMVWKSTIGIHGNYESPIYSDSLAINPNQRAEHERLFPNIRLDKQNRPIFDNFVNHENYLKKCGFVKQRQKIKNCGKNVQTKKV